MSPLASTKDGSVASAPGYAEVAPAGTVAVELKTGEQVISSQSVPLREDRYYTFIGWREGGRWQIKAFADGPSASNAADRPLRMLNFIDGRETEFYIDGVLGKKLLPASIEEIRVPAKEVMLAIKVLDPREGHPSQTSTAYDLARTDSAYLVVANDYLGRPDPLVIAGGPSPAEQVSEPEEQNLPPTPEQRIKEKQKLQALEIEHRRAQLAALDAAEKGPNKIPNAAELRRQIEQEIKELQKPASAVP